MIEYEKYFKYKIKYIELLGGAPKKCNKNNVSTLKDININIIIININGERNTLYKTVKEGSNVGFLIIELLMTKVDIKWNENNQAK
jgi:hypothetical protein